jgi:rubredoxin
MKPDLLVDDWVERYADQPISRFYPSAVVSATGLETSVVVARLVHLATDTKLRVLREIYCPQCSRLVDRTELESVQDVATPMVDELECPFCGYVFPPSPRDSVLGFRFDPEYQELKKKWSHVTKAAYKPTGFHGSP